MRTLSRDEILDWSRRTFQPSSQEDIQAYFAEADKPLVDVKDRVEVIMLVIDNDRAEALKCVEGLFLTTHPFKLTIYDNLPNPRNTAKIWNKLIRESDAEYIMLIDSDVIPRNDILTPLVQLLKHEDKTCAVGPIGDGAIPIEYQKESKANGNPFEIGVHLSGCCFMFKKSLLEKIGYWDEDFVFYGQDSEWATRAVYLGYKMWLTPKAFITHGDSVSATRLKEAGKMNPNRDSEVAHILHMAKSQHY